MDDSLFTDPLYSLQSPSSAGDKIYTAGDFLTASARGGGGVGGGAKKKIDHLMTGLGYKKNSDQEVF